MSRGGPKDLKSASTKSTKEKNDGGDAAYRWVKFCKISILATSTYLVNQLLSMAFKLLNYYYYYYVLG